MKVDTERVPPPSGKKGGRSKRRKEEEGEGGRRTRLEGGEDIAGGVSRGRAHYCSFSRAEVEEDGHRFLISHGRKTSIFLGFHKGSFTELKSFSFLYSSTPLHAFSLFLFGSGVGGGEIGPTISGKFSTINRFLMFYFILFYFFG